MSELNKKLEEADSDDEEVVVKKEEVPVVEEDTSLANPDVVTKYQEAAKIVQAALVEIVARCVPGARIVDICRFGDDLIESRTAAIYRNKNKAGKVVLRGIAFPLCVSVNDCVCHCSPLESDTEYPDLAEGDMVKLDLGAHIDGFIALAAHTCLVGVDVSDPAVAASVEAGARANVLNAAYVAAEVASKMIKNGNTNNKVTAAIKQVAEMFGVSPISGTLMHQMKQYVVDGKKMILLKEEPEQKVEACTFETGEVYAIDIAMTTGDGKPRDLGKRTTVYKRAVEVKYGLKNKGSRDFFNAVNKKYPTLPFSVRAVGDEKMVKLGVRECVTHGLLMPYPVLYERKGDFIAHVKFTVLLLPSGTLQITGLPSVTYDAMVTTGAAGPAVPTPMNANIGRVLVQQLLKERPETVVPEGITALLEEVRVEKAKKVRKPKAKAVKA
ncbi:peptidase M24, structural domain-containing protein [Ochromonadaceae sp. CCMP2298]|nr:peptidase M24, structural domain-containing protein [Ochromonadaceae sp. CCMP2298]